METKVRNFNNPYYPYEKPNAFNTLRGAELIPYKLVMYLLDLPDKYGYEPVDDNNRPRVRLMKYLWYDEPNPLSMPLPTPEQKLSMLYNGEKAAITTEEDKRNHPKGYRIMAQIYTEPSSVNADINLKCYLAREIPRSDFKTVIGVDFQVVTNYALDNIMKTAVYSRSYAIHQCLVEALHGVDMAGVGTIHYSKPVHGDSGRSLYHSEGSEIYSDTFFAIDWQESQYPVNVVPNW
jgi:hypothetical protein